MELSVIIVNYNVKYFLEQCLHSVSKAVEGMETEVFVVDNNSVDGSCSHIRKKFPWVNPANMTRVEVDISAETIASTQTLEVTIDEC